jgi:hypothetical protein
MRTIPKAPEYSRESALSFNRGLRRAQATSLVGCAGCAAAEAGPCDSWQLDEEHLLGNHSRVKEAADERCNERALS